MTAEDIIDRLGLRPHPEGGWYTEVWRAPAERGTRATGSSILYMLPAGERSHWHKVDADEVWSFHGGAPLALRVGPDGGPATEHRLGLDLDGGERPQVVVPAGHWQSAMSTGDWTLVGCVVSPAFDFDGFELAPDDFDLPGA